MQTCNAMENTQTMSWAGHSATTTSCLFYFFKLDFYICHKLERKLIKIPRNKEDNVSGESNRTRSIKESGPKPSSLNTEREGAEPDDSTCQTGETQKHLRMIQP